MKQLWALFSAFFKVGIFAYGGGQSMIPLVQQEVVESHKWMNITEFSDLLALGNALPGPITTKLALAIGYKIAGHSGAITALAGLLLPSSVLMLLVMTFFVALKDAPRMQAFLRGIRPAVMALLFIVAYDIGKTSVVSAPTVLIGIAVFLILLLTRVHPAVCLIASGMIGLLFL